MKPVRPQLMPESGGVGASRVETFKKCKMKNSLFSVSEVSHQLSKGRFCSHTKNLVGKRAKKKNHAKTDLWCHSAFQAIFTNLGAVGREGPKSLGSYYAGQDQDGQVTLSKGIQLWTVPYTGKYRIETIGAAGGYNPFATGSPQYRGRGTIMIGTFELNKGDVIQILVGQEGGIGGGRNGPGGGGGTFVVKKDRTPLIIAGGGGGVKIRTLRLEGCNANTSTTGNPGNNLLLSPTAKHGALSLIESDSGKVISYIGYFTISILPEIKYSSPFHRQEVHEKIIYPNLQFRKSFQA